MWQVQSKLCDDLGEIAIEFLAITFTNYDICIVLWKDPSKLFVRPVEVVLSNDLLFEFAAFLQIRLATAEDVRIFLAERIQNFPYHFIRVVLFELLHLLFENLLIALAVLYFGEDKAVAAFSFKKLMAEEGTSVLQRLSEGLALEGLEGKDETDVQRFDSLDDWDDDVDVEESIQGTGVVEALVGGQVPGMSMMRH